MITIILLVLLFPLALLGYRLQVKVSKFFGRLLWRFGGRRRAVVLCNLKATNPEWGQDKLWHAGVRVFENFAGYFLLNILNYFRWPSRCNIPYEIIGAEHLVKDSNRPVIILGSHTVAALDFSMLVYRDTSGLGVGFSYRRLSNFILDKIFLRNRLHSYSGSYSVPVGNNRALYRALSTHQKVFLYPDHSVISSDLIYCDLLGVRAAYSKTIVKYINKFNPKIVQLTAFYDGDFASLKFYLQPISSKGDSVLQDYSANLTDMLRCSDDYLLQYFWLHRRFKQQPDPNLNFYSLG